MTTQSSANTLEPLVRAMVTATTGASATDVELLTRFIDHRDEAAFAALVHRHGPMVLGVCRRILPNEADAEDVFQAIFLVLALKAASVAPRELVAGWLHGVARQVALRARRANTRRTARERQVDTLPEPESVTRDDRWDDLLPVLDRELSRLPDHYRTILVLCDLEGVTRQAAARQLGLPEGTVNSRLSRARAMLADRLTRCGVVCSVSALVAVFAQSATACVPMAMTATAIRVAALVAEAGTATTGGVAAEVANLTEGVVRTMFVTKLKTAVAVVLILGVLATGATFLNFRTAAGQDKPTAEKPVEPAKKEQITGNKVPEDKELLQGTWQVVEAIGKGEPGKITDEEGRLHHRAVFKGDQVEFHGGKGAFVLDPSKKPKQMDWTQRSSGEGKGNKILGIYELKGDTLRYCLAMPGEERPTEFKSVDGPRPEGKAILYVFKRIKSEDEKKPTVEDGVKQEKDKEPFTAWGKEINGLQAGLGFKAGQKRVYHPGETVQLVVRVRYLGQKELKVSYFNGFFSENPPAVTDGDGKPVALEGSSRSGLATLKEVVLTPGKEVEVCETTLALKPLTERGKGKPVWTLFGTGKFQLHYGTVLVDNLATGKLELEVKEAEEKGPEKKGDKEPFTAWGKEVGGLQAGLGFAKDQKRVYSNGETVTLVVRVRNVGKENVCLHHIKKLCADEPPKVTKADGSPVNLEAFPAPKEPQKLKELNLAPGEEVELDTLQIDLKAENNLGDPPAVATPCLRGTGKFRVSYDRLAPKTTDNIGSKLASGELELEVKEAEKRLPGGLLTPKVDPKAVLPAESPGTEDRSKIVPKR